jgi:hypothetical protein
MRFVRTALATTLVSAAALVAGCKDESPPAAKGMTQVTWAASEPAPANPTASSGAVTKDPKGAARVTAEASPAAATTIVNTANKGPREAGVGVEPSPTNSTTVGRNPSSAQAGTRPSVSRRNPPTQTAAMGRRRV